MLIQKLNYLIGMCYPSFNVNRMVAPFINLTIGDILSAHVVIVSISYINRNILTMERNYFDKVYFL